MFELVSQVEQVLAKMDEEQLSNAKEVSELNQQIQALRERTHRVDDFDLLTAQKVPHCRYPGQLTRLFARRTTFLLSSRRREIN